MAIPADAIMEEALGAYIGPATFGEIVDALEAHSEWVAELRDPSGTLLWRKAGWSWHTVKTDDSFMFAAAKTEQGAGNPTFYIDAPVVLVLHRELPSTASCKLYVGGLVFTPGFGDYRGHTLTLVAWHGISHVTPTGDIAPGFGPARVDVQEMPPEDERRAQ